MGSKKLVEEKYLSSNIIDYNSIFDELEYEHNINSGELFYEIIYNEIKLFCEKLKPEIDIFYNNRYDELVDLIHSYHTEININEIYYHDAIIYLAQSIWTGASNDLYNELIFNKFKYSLNDLIPEHLQDEFNNDDKIINIIFKYTINKNNINEKNIWTLENNCIYEEIANAFIMYNLDYVKKNKFLIYSLFMKVPNKNNKIIKLFRKTRLNLDYTYNTFKVNHIYKNINLISTSKNIDNCLLSWNGSELKGNIIILVITLDDDIIFIENKNLININKGLTDEEEILCKPGTTFICTEKCKNMQTDLLPYNLPSDVNFTLLNLKMINNISNVKDAPTGYKYPEPLTINKVFL
tara:strand:+ start:7621 stop:8673 length:1053 start_codon:yes stop_codon:yes gene_type:complete